MDSLNHPTDHMWSPTGPDIHRRPVDLLVRSARMVTPEGIRAACLTVEDGRITAILPLAASVPARRVIDAGGRYVLPGLIDSHVHFRTPGLTHKEDWAHASRAAAAGGITTVIDMPNTVPPLFNPADTHAKAAAITGDSLVDFRFHLGVDGAHPELLAEVTPREATSAKMFMAGHHTAPHVVRSADQLDRVFAVAADSGLRLVVHAEDDAIFALLDGWRGAPGTYSDYEPSRPRSGGIVAVARLIELARRHGTAVHVLHVSSAEEADLLAAAGHAGLPVTFEVTAHHLSFVAEDTTPLGSRIRLSPAIRSATDRERLWQAVSRGEVSTIGSDHAPHALVEKLRPVADAPPGLPGVQELLPAVFTGLTRRRADLHPDRHVELVAQLMAASPAALFGLSHRKGRIAVGMDADLTVLDHEHPWTFTPGDVQAKCGWSAYEGWMFTGRAVLTVRRGEVIWDAETRAFGAPTGVWLDAAPAPADGELDTPLAA